MAESLTHFSCSLDVGSATNAARARDLCDKLAIELDREGESLGFELEVDPTLGPGALWIGADGFGEPEHVIRFVLACAAAFDLKGRWGFTWALTCARPRGDGFGGGAQVLDLSARRSLAWTDCAHWRDALLDPEPRPVLGIG